MYLSTISINSPNDYRSNALAHRDNLYYNLTWLLSLDYYFPGPVLISMSFKLIIRFKKQFCNLNPWHLIGFLPQGTKLP